MKPKTAQLKSGFEVEWCESVPKFADGSSDMDRAEFLTRDFSTHDEAIAFAKDRLPFDCFGSVRVTPFEFEPHFPGCRSGHREWTADPEHIEN